MKLSLTDRFCAAAKPEAGKPQTDYFDESVTGLALRVATGGRKTWTLHYTWDGKRARLTFGTYPATSLSVARTRAIEAKGQVEAGNDPRSINTETIADLLDDFVSRYVEKDAKLRSAGYIKDVIDRLVKPTIGGLGRYEIKRSHVVQMLDAIADRNGPVMADRTLAIVRKAFNWQAARDDEFVPPIAKGMAKTKPRARERILSDDEIRAVWRASAEGVFGSFVRFLLLTAVRRTEAARMTWGELSDDVWTIPAGRMKGKVEHVVPLSPAAKAIVDAGGSPFVFTTDGKTPISGFAKFKATFDRQSGVTGWTLHDLRRTARSLMSRAGVDADVAERCLAHAIGGVRGVYDRHSFLSEKREALAKLADLITSITSA